MANSYNTANQQTPTLNSTSNYNTTSNQKSQNGFVILTGMANPDTASYVQNYMAMVFDAVTDTSVKKSANVTSYAVEGGKSVSDNVSIKNAQFTLQGVVSETIIPRKSMLDLLASASGGSRISQAIEYLDQIFEARQPIVLLTEHRVFENVILTGIDYEYKSEFAMVFSLSFEQVRLVGGATTNVIATKTASTRNGGKKTKTRVENAGGSGNVTNPGGDTITPAFPEQ
ncbi:hypothetical protein SR70_06620 [Klebsiella aerogenes]|uniref:phage baseplate protein n=1 Tax=Klebsiella aerogenes TaxID=548 RepID=UPI0005EE65BA|nr:hypothetical protein [Klebsiella aerogenes]KJP43141.1 hypothetical protein SR70_06620 [Klebsiella aerogenes]